MANSEYTDQSDLGLHCLPICQEAFVNYFKKEGLGSGKNCIHYHNIPMQYTVIFHGCKNSNFQIKSVIFLILA